MAAPEPDQVGLLSAVALPASVTALCFVPGLFSDPSTQGLSWLGAALVAAPGAAYLVNRRRPVVTNLGRAILVGLPHIPLCLALMLLDVWLDVRSGYLLAGSGEVAMAVGVGAVFALGLGIVLAGLVAASSRLGASGHARRRSRAGAHADVEPR